MSQIVVCALYKFVELENFRELRRPLVEVMRNDGIRGTLLLAGEGINGTVSGSRPAIDRLLQWLRADPRLATIDRKESLTDRHPFKRAKVKLKREIVTMGVSGIDPKRVVGTYVEPEDWSTLISDPEVLLIDTRNDYEVNIGTFKNAVNPNTRSFREFPRFAEKNLDPAKHKKVAMFCTGGIRCEKSTAYLKTQGFEQVFHLKGGILNYLQQVSEQETLWQGECFVFDERVTVDHRLEPGNYDQCNACRMPITEADKASAKYRQGVSCPHCYDRTSDARKRRFQEREKQIRLAWRRGEDHLGEEAAKALAARREAKLLRQMERLDMPYCDD